MMELEALTPLHIGSGGMITPMEYVVDDDFYRVDMDKLFQDPEFDSEFLISSVGKGERVILNEQFKECGMRNALYSAKISRQTKSNLSGEVRECIKSRNRAYIPGSSLKGAIRTAVLYYVLKNNPEMLAKAYEKIRRALKGKRRERIGEDVESLIFGRSANEDVMKVIEVSDSFGSDMALEVREVKTLSTKPNAHTWKSFSTFVECIKANERARFNLNVVEFYLQDRIAEKLGFNDKREFVRRFRDACKTFSLDLIEHEIRFYESYNRPRELDSIIEFYKRLKESDELLLHFAWGAGWHSMSIGMLLKKSRILSDIRAKFYRRTAKVPEFPKTRKVIFDDGKPYLPLGWAKVSVSE